MITKRQYLIAKLTEQDKTFMEALDATQDEADYSLDPELHTYEEWESLTGG